MAEDRSPSSDDSPLPSAAMAQRPSRFAMRRNVVIGAIAAIVAMLSLAHQLRSASYRYREVDFRIFYAWWTEYAAGGDPWLAQAKRTIIRPGLSRPSFCNYTPTFVAGFSPLSHLSQRAAFHVWQAMQIAALLAAILMLGRGLDPPAGIAATLVIIALAIVSSPFRGTLTYSQLSPMLLVMEVGAWYFARRGHDAIGGISLACASLLKMYPAALGGYFLFTRRWRALGWAIAFFVLGVLVSGPGRWLDFAGAGIAHSIHAVPRSSLTVLAYVHGRVAQAGIGAPSASWIVFAITAAIDAALITVAAWASIRSRPGDASDGLAMGMWIAAAVLLSPLAWIHETVQLIPLYVFGFAALWRARIFGSQGSAAMRTGGAVLALTIVPDFLKAGPHAGFISTIAAFTGAAITIGAIAAARES